MSSDADTIQRIKEAEEKSQIEIDNARKENEKKIRELEERHKSDMADLKNKLENEMQKSHSMMVAKTREYREKVMNEARSKAASLKLNLTDKEIKKIVSSVIEKTIGE